MVISFKSLPSLARRSTISFSWIPTWLGIQWISILVPPASALAALFLIRMASLVRRLAFIAFRALSESVNIRMRSMAWLLAVSIALFIAASSAMKTLEPSGSLHV